MIVDLPTSRELEKELAPLEKELDNINNYLENAYKLESRVYELKLRILRTKIDETADEFESNQQKPPVAVETLVSWLRDLIK